MKYLRDITAAAYHLNGAIHLPDLTMKQCGNGGRLKFHRHYSTLFKWTKLNYCLANVYFRALIFS